MSNSIANSSTMNLLPVQAYFNADGTFNTFVGQGQPFTVPFSGGAITGATINNSSIGATTPSTGAFTSLSSTADATIHGLTVGLGGGSIGSNTAVGYQAGYSNTTGGITALGNQALYYNTTGTHNVGVGNNALVNNTTGNNNVAIGDYSLISNTTASNNTAFGYQAGYSNTTGANNTAMGYQAGYSNTTGSPNVYVGYQAGYSNQSGTNNVFIGRISGFYATGVYNTVVGDNAGGALTTGGSNTILGPLSGGSLTTGSNNVYVGYTTASAGSVSNEIVVGYSITGKGANTAFIGGSSGAYNGANSATWSVTSDIRIKKNVVSLESGLDVISALRPVEFDYIENNKHDIGFIAQEYQEVLPAQITEGEDGMLSLNQNLVPYLVKAIQELQAEVQSLKSQLKVK